jgi:hypothetical protein
VITPVPYLQWATAAGDAAAAVGNATTGSGSSQHAVAGNSSRLAMKLPSVAVCMEWVGLASLRSVPWMQLTSL